MEDTSAERIIQTEIKDEMKSSYLDYAMSVIVSRALPDARDGLKPVHRRILYAMHSMGMHFNKPFRKSARIVGEVIGKYHPHGDAAVYDTLVRMAQDFSLRYPLVAGQGNFGSIDGDSAAAMRYTESKLAKISNQMLADIDKETVAFAPNFDESIKEPVVLPAKLPNLLLNGASGIAVGMATNIPPHNLREVCAGITAVIENPDITIKQLSEIIKGPDFPTGAVIYGKRGILEAYNSGRGKIIVKAKSHIEEDKGKTRIILDEIPFMVNKAQLLQQIAELVKSKAIDGISDIRDESDRDGMRGVIELKRGANHEIVLNQLYKHTRCQVTYGANMLAIVNRKPKMLNLRGLIDIYISHRKRVIENRTRFELRKAQERAHILNGLKAALNEIDKVIKLIKSSRDASSARTGLQSLLNIDDIQANAILEMQLQRLTNMEQDKIIRELGSLYKLIEELKGVLANENRIFEIIKNDLKGLAEEFGDERKTIINEIEEENLDIEDLIEPEEVVVTISHVGYIKRVPLKEYKQQKRGGKGIIAASTREEDFIEDIFVANTHDTLLFFTDKGKVHWLKVYQIPAGTRQSKGSAAVNLLQLDKDTVTAYIAVKKFNENLYLVMATKNGIIKKSSLAAYSRPRKGGIIACSLDNMDELINVVLTNGKDDIILATRKGNAVRFHERNLRVIGRSARGVRGIRLRPDDKVIGMVIADESKAILTVTENGYGKRSRVADYRLTSRGGTGVINIKTTERNGDVVAIRSVTDDDELMLISQRGVVIRTISNGIPIIGRNTMGVRLMRLQEHDRVTGVAKIILNGVE